MLLILAGVIAISSENQCIFSASSEDRPRSPSDEYFDPPTEAEEFSFVQPAPDGYYILIPTIPIYAFPDTYMVTFAYHIQCKDIQRNPLEFFSLTSLTKIQRNSL